MLVDLGMGFLASSYKEWMVYATVEPDNPNTPDNIITVYGTSGQLDGRFQIDGEVQEHYGIMIRVRANHPRTGYQKIKAIALKLDQEVNAAVVSIPDETGTGVTLYTVHCATRTSSMLSLGKDRENSGRDLFTINYLMSITQGE